MFTQLRLLLGIVGAGAVWIADIAASASNAAPDWLKEYGLPGIFLALTVYAVRTLFAANQSMQKEALSMKDAQIKAAEDTAKVHLETAKELIAATNHQTAQFEKLTEELKHRPCQMTKP